MTDGRWDLLSTLEGIAVGFVTAVVTVAGWFNAKFRVLHERIDKANGKIDILEEQSAAHKAGIMVQEAHHMANINRLDRIERETVKQTDMLTELIRAQRRA